MEEFLKLVAANYIPIIVTLGVVICLAGILRMLFSRAFNWTGLAVIFLGGVFAGIPLISKASIGKDGLEIVTNLNLATEELNAAVKANGDAIASLREGLAAIETLVAQSDQVANPSGAIAVEALKNSLDASEVELKAIDSATSSVIQRLEANDMLINGIRR